MHICMYVVFMYQCMYASVGVCVLICLSFSLFTFLFVFTRLATHKLPPHSPLLHRSEWSSCSWSRKAASPFQSPSLSPFLPICPLLVSRRQLATGDPLKDVLISFLLINTRPSAHTHPHACRHVHIHIPIHTHTYTKHTHTRARK